MKFYRTSTEYNCGIDLHSRQMYMCLMDHEGNKLVHTNIQGNDWDYFLSRVKPYQPDLTVCCECTFNWYWLADACAAEGIEFVLAHALYLKAIHGGKNKNDRIDSEKLAHLLRTNLIPPAYVYPAATRSIRDLLRRRTSFVWKRAELQHHLTCMPLVQGQEPVKKCQHRVREHWFEQLRPRFDEPMRKLSAEADMYLIKEYDAVIAYNVLNRQRRYPPLMQARHKLDRGQDPGVPWSHIVATCARPAGHRSEAPTARSGNQCS